MFIQTEPTPNPLTFKFIPGRVVMEEGTLFFQNESESINSPFGKRLFSIAGVTGVFFGSDFITITKKEDHTWEIMKPLILGAIMDHYNSDDKVIVNNDSNKQNDSNVISENKEDDSVVKQIKELLVEILFFKIIKKVLYIYICKDLAQDVLALQQL